LQGDFLRGRKASERKIIMKIIRTATVVLGILALGTTLIRAEVSFVWARIGDINNAPDPRNMDNVPGIGSVSYVYDIASTAVTLNQYTEFLNAVAKTDSYGLYNTNMATELNSAGIARVGENGSYTYTVIGSGLRPVTYVSWFDAARFANWMANGQRTGVQDGTTTENGAYSLWGANSGVNFTKNAINPNTSAATTYWIPSENEWYKAAYYEVVDDPESGEQIGKYWLYPTRSDTAPGNLIGDAENQANYKSDGGVYSVTQSAVYSESQNYLSDVGAFTNSESYYVTYDQGGNVWEWNDAVIREINRGLRGGSWSDKKIAMESTSSFFSQSEQDNYGFRVAGSVVPEPSTAGLILLGGAVYWLGRRRKVAL